MRSHQTSESNITTKSHKDEIKTVSKTSEVNMNVSDLKKIANSSRLKMSGQTSPGNFLVYDMTKKTALIITGDYEDIENICEFSEKNEASPIAINKVYAFAYEKKDGVCFDDGMDGIGDEFFTVEFESVKTYEEKPSEIPEGYFLVKIWMDENENEDEEGLQARWEYVEG